MSRVMRKPTFWFLSLSNTNQAVQLQLYYQCSKNKGADQPDLCLCVRMCKMLVFFLNPKFQASSYLLWLYSLVCVGRGQRPRRPVFSQRGSYYLGSKTKGADQLIFFFFFFFFSLTSLSRLFHSYRDEPIGRWGETGVPRENHLTHPQAEHGLSHKWPVRGSNLHQSQR